VGGVALVAGIALLVMYCWSCEAKKGCSEIKHCNYEEFAMTNRRKAYEEKLDAQLEEWNAQIALFKARADKAKAEVKIEYYKTIETLQHKQDEARVKLHELKTAGDGAWEDLQSGAEKAWAEFKSAFQRAALKFK
jgi:hypothetical protein